MKKISVLIDPSSIENKVKLIANTISKDYEGKEITLVVILKGSMIFASDLARKITNKVKFEVMKVSSYVGSESKNLAINLDIDGDISGKDIIIVEDIIDTGKTLYHLKQILNERNPSTIRICALLDKPSKREYEVEADYKGFIIEDNFVVGYGLDYSEEYRNLPYIGKIE